MATNAAVAVMMIFIMLIPLCLDTRTSDRVTPQFAPLATAVELFFTAAHSSSFAEYDAARYNILNEGLRRHPGEIQSRGYHGQSQGAYGSTSPTRERFLTELTLDPPDATSDEAGVPYSAKGQDWRAVFILNAIDGSGNTPEFEEERRLVYVAMTRAKDHLHLILPQRFFAHQLKSNGDRHMYTARTRFIPDSIVDRFEVCAWPEATTAAMGKSANVRPVDIGTRMRRMWR
jgi:superfamily I DNA/RNA helicase